MKETKDMPPGGMKPLSNSMKSHGQGRNKGGYGASQADLERGFVKVDQPEKLEDPKPHRRGETKGGFIHRYGFSVER